MIKIDNLYFSYTNSEPFILHGINLIINDGEYISILGENGSGKSTFIKLILKFLLPTKGSITDTSKSIGYVPQRSDSFNSQFPITVFEMMNCYRKLLKLKDKNTAANYLKMVNMYDYRDSLIGNLSGGQCQKIFIARALMGNPDLLVFDEPSTGVDIGSQKEIYRLIKELNVKNKITVIAVEHNLNAALTNSSLIYHLSNGNGHMCKPEQYIEEMEGIKLDNLNTKNLSKS